MSQPMTLQILRAAVTGGAAAFRCVTEYQPAGGEGDKVFPPTYNGGKYATEKRRLPGQAEPVDCVLLDSVQSQANRMELALLETWERSKGHTETGQRFPLPVITVQFPSDKGLQKVLRITSLEAPHRIADALLRDSQVTITKGKDGRDLKDEQGNAKTESVSFRESDFGAALDHVDIRNATALFKLCPTALVFGMWVSTGPKGGLGAKFQRALVSEIVGIGVTAGVKTSSRIDPAQIVLKAGPLYHAVSGGWTLDESHAAKAESTPMKLGKDGKPSEANHGNVPPTITEGGVTLASARQTTVLSLPALRRLRFPLTTGKPSDLKVDDAARTALAALALCAATLTREQGCDLRSRCLLVPTAATTWELIDKPLKPGEKVTEYTLDSETAIDLFRGAVSEAKKAGLPLLEEELVLTPSPELVALVKKSQELSAATGGAEERSET